jgi:hypothetical protein
VRATLHRSVRDAAIRFQEDETKEHGRGLDSSRIARVATQYVRRLLEGPVRDGGRTVRAVLLEHKRERLASRLLSSR